MGQINLNPRDWRMAYALAELDGLMGLELERLAEVHHTIRLVSKQVEDERREVRGVLDSLNTVDDLVQESLTWLVEGRHKIAESIARPDLGMGAIHRALKMDFANQFANDLSRPWEVSLERVVATFGETSLRHGRLLLPDELRPGTSRAIDAPEHDDALWQPLLGQQYSSEAVSILLPALWDNYQGDRPVGRRSVAERSVAVRRPTSNRAAGNSLSACIVDMQIAWQRAPLSLQQRQCLFLGVGLDWSDLAVAQFLAVSDRTVRRHVSSGLSTLSEYMNGRSGGLTEAA